MATTQINLRLDDATLRRVDESRGDIPRNRWLTRAIERELTDPSPQQRSEWTARSGGAYDSHPEVVAANRTRSSQQAKADVQPRQKGK